MGKKDISMQLLEKEFNTLNPEQRQAALHREGPLLVLAGAGSGKTKVVAIRIAHLINTGIDPKNILGLTFTNKAAQEMKERVNRFVGKDIIVSTFHSLGARILREAIHYLGYTPQFAIYDEDDVEKLLKTIAKEAFPAEVKFDVKKARTAISANKNALGQHEDKEYDQFYQLYIKKLKECNAVDFDDLLFLPVTLFRDFPDLLAYYQNRWNYLLVDEYQDTNMVQYEFVRLLVAKSQNLFVVGDPDQSIYSWRGANIRNILHFENDYPGAQIVRLEQNYRSTETILQAANAVIQNNTQRFKKSLWCSRGEGEKINVYTAQTERDEAEFVANTITHLQSVHDIPLNEVVIFYRTNFQSRAFEDQLIAKRIPYTIVGGISFYHRKEIKDILSFLRLLEHPNDLIAFLRVVNLPKRGFGEQFLAKVVGAARNANVSLLDLFTAPSPFAMSAKQKEGWQDFAQILAMLKEAKASKSLSELVRAAIMETKYLEVINADTETRQEKRENLAELIVKAEEWEQSQAAPSLTKFLEEIALVTSTDDLDTTELRVSLMTAHNGKGLEFQAVFLVGIEEELFPHVNSKKSEEDVEEERRLFYVGITRAKKILYICHASFRHLWGTLRHMRPSRFLYEIPAEFRKKTNLYSSYY
ncbi:MAG: uvrD [Chlamydiia bacterium]|nr:uvrD [Chlamydiia bacterium]